MARPEASWLDQMRFLRPKVKKDDLIKTQPKVKKVDFFDKILAKSEKKNRFFR